MDEPKQENSVISENAIPAPELVVTSAPYIHTDSSLKKIMYDVVLALSPGLAWAVYVFGWSALGVMFTAVISGYLFEYLSLMARGEPRKKYFMLDGSVLVTSLLLAMNLPSGSPFWMTIIGSFVAVVIAKHAFGGLGYNLFNPALVARVFLLISFPVQMTRWVVQNSHHTTDAVTAVTSLEAIRSLKKTGQPFVSLNISDLFFGNTPGSLGEVSDFLLLVGAAYLLIRKVISWEIPLSVLFSLGIFTGIFYLVDPAHYAPPILHILSGGAVLGAFFMATDLVTCPLTRKGKIIFGAGIGLITGLIRLFGSYPEGISFAILMMNALVPLIDSGTRAKKFGS